MMLVRTIRAGDEPRWRTLWAGYTRFYRTNVPEEVTAELLAQLVADSGPVYGLVAESDGVVVGFATYLFHPSTWSRKPSCYLEDLFVDSAARGAGVGRALILAVEDAALKQNASRLYWHTQEYNAPARALYDTLASRTSFLLYRKAL